MIYQDREAGSDSKHHVLIIGGGPAGSAAALTLLKYSNVLVSVVESSDFSQQRLGEVTSAGIAPLLQYLGIEEQSFLNKHLSSYESISSWGSSEIHNRSSTFSVLGGGWHLDRNTFDSDLFTQVEQNGGMVYRSAKLIEAIMTHENKWQLSLKHKGKIVNLVADYIIDASGKKSILPRKLGVEHHLLDNLVGLTVFFKTNETRHFLSIESIPYGWWYSAVVPNNQLAVTLMTDADIGRQYKFSRFNEWMKLLKSSKHTRERLPANADKTRIFVRPAHSQIIKCITGNKWVATGDSAVSFDPLSSLGIGHAVSSGIEAARAIIAYFQLDDSLLNNYCHVIAATFKKVVSRQKEFYLKEQRWSKHEFWSRRHLDSYG
ncbi:MAG: tryptophan 7-halogenase [Bacteroidota bacterium]|nr:tryptophan 7-halogenase [Bacteroidota bacterium]